MKSIIDINEVLEFYKTHSNVTTCNNFHISKNRLKAILRENGVDIRSKAENTRLTNLEKYGVENPFQSRALVEAGIVKKSGSKEEHYKNVANKMKATNLEKYGTTCSLHNEEVQNKVKATNLAKYGTEYYFASEDAKQKLALKAQEIKDKSKKTCLEKYGAESVFQVDEVKSKIKQTIMDRYGVEYFCMSKECKKYSSSNSKPNINFKSLLEASNIDFDVEFPLDSKSFDFKVGDDLIEINPTPTHNSTLNIFDREPLDKNYHKNKTQVAVENGYRCIHVWDWDDENKIIDFLKPKDTIYARNCSIKEVDLNTAKTFINKYHFQNYAKDSIRIGLFYKDELISIMTFGRPRYNKKYEYELVRYCSSMNIIGGAEKLFKYFLNNYNPTSIISYCDLSKFTGDVYKKLGFKLSGNPAPSKHWYNMRTQKHITDNLLRQQGFDRLFKTDFGKNTSNEELMKANGFVEVYDCGQATYIFVK